MTDTFLTVEEAAKRLAVTPYTLREWLRAGKLRGVQVSRRWRVPERALFELATATPTATPPDASKPDAQARVGQLDEFLKSVEALSQRKTDENATQAQAEAIWAQMTSDQAGAHNAALRELFQAPDAVQRIVMARSAEAAARYGATPEGEAELADWRALDGEPFHDEGGDYYSAEEEAEFRAERAAKGAAQ